MTREVPALAKNRANRAIGNTLFFNKPDRMKNECAETDADKIFRFARSLKNPYLGQWVADMEHRPAPVPGAD